MASVGVYVDDYWWSGRCWICNDAEDHGGKPHSEATGDGLTRWDIVQFMNQGAYLWR